MIEKNTQQSRKRFLGSMAALLLAPVAMKAARAAPMAPAGKTGAEDAVNAILQNYITGFRTRNAEMLTSPEIYSTAASGDNIYVLYDLMPGQAKDKPNEDVGTQDLLAKNKAYMAASKGPTTISFSEVHIDGNDEFAFYRGMMNAAFTYKDGRDFSASLRHTMVLKKIDGKFMMIHEHISVPSFPMGIATPNTVKS